MKNILVTIDFTDNENRLIDQASQLAKAFDSKIWLMHIAAPDPDFVGYEVGPQYIRDTRAADLRTEHRKLQAYSADLKANGIEADGLLIQGITVDLILAEAEKLKVDLIIAGHHEHGVLYHTFFGSTSTTLMENSTIPVMIVPLG